MDVLQQMYWSLLEDTQHHTNPRFVEGLSRQNAAEQERGRAAVLTFSSTGGPTEATTFTRSDDLRTYLDNAASENLNISPRRRLYLLEDIGRKYVEVVGSRLRIPPAFFGAQWTDPSYSLPLIDPETLSQDLSRYFQLKYRQTHTLSEETGAEDYQLGLYYDANSNVPRRLQLLDYDEPYQYSKHQLSYWGNNLEGDSWVAVLLLDPLISQASIAKKYATSGEHFIHLDHPTTGPGRFPHANYQSLGPLSPDPQQWKLQPQGPCMLSIFDDLLFVHTHKGHDQTTKDPMSVTSVCRNLIRCTWETYLASRTKEYHANLDNILFKNPVTNASSWFQTWDTAWRVEVFRRLTSTRRAIEEAVVKDIGISLKVLGVNHSNMALSTLEIEEWASLQSSGTALIDKYAFFIDAYLQENTIQESRTSNDQARSVGYLTSLATILVPFSIVAGMFSMGGEFLAGQSHFWVFWAVTIPVVVTLGVVLFTRVLQSSFGCCVWFCNICSRWIQEGWLRLFRLLRKEHEEDLEEVVPADESFQLSTQASAMRSLTSQHRRNSRALFHNHEALSSAAIEEID